MTTYGVTDSGFVKKPLEQILKDVQDRHRTSFGASIDAAIATELGQLDGNFASDVAELWELGEICWHAFDPNATTGVSLTALCSLTGTVPRAAVASISHQQQCLLLAGTTIPTGALVSISSRPDITFAYLGAPFTNTTGIPGYFNLEFTCTQTGPIVAVAGVIDTIRTPVTGWGLTVNVADVEVGRDADTTTELRQRREDELALRGGSSVRAIRADLLDFANHPELTGINQVQILENKTSNVDANGLPPHSIEAVIDDGLVPAVANQDILNALWEATGGGIETFGGISGMITDDNGDAQPMKFSRFTLRPVYIALTLTVNDKFPSDGVTQVKTALTALGATLRGGDEVVALAFRAAALTVAGVVDVPVYNQAFTPAPVTGPNLFPAKRERATFNSANIAVTV